MATITINTTDAEDAAITYATAVFNADHDTDHQETPLQFFRRHIRAKLDFWLQQAAADARVNRGELYQRADDADRAAIDAILAKYQ